MAPHNRSIKEFAGEEGVGVSTLHGWRKQARKKEILLHDCEAGQAVFNDP